MTVFDRRALSSPGGSVERSLAALAGLALMGSIALLLHRVAPGAPAIVPMGLAALFGLAALALPFTLNDAALPTLTKALAIGVGLIALGALCDQETRLSLASFASAAFGVGLAVWLACTAPKRRRASLPLAASFAVTLGCLIAYAAFLVLASRDLMIADFMTYRGIAVIVARLADAGNWPLLLSAAVQSITQDYSWAPALVLGLMLALTAPTSRAVYTFALLALYAAPALFALAILSRDLARRAGLAGLPSPQPSPATPGSQPTTPTHLGSPRGSASPACWGRWREAPDGVWPAASTEVGLHDPHRELAVEAPWFPHPIRRLRRHLPHFAGKGGVRPPPADEGQLALGALAAFVAFPAAFAVAARGMPDVGGLVLFVCALRLAERLARLLALPQRHDAWVAPMTRRVAVALALTVFAMFAFRRWYAFAAAGVVTMLATEVASIALMRGARFRSKDAVAAAALGLLTVLALASPVIVEWAPNLSAHDYASVYVAYRKPPDVFLGELGDWIGLVPALAGLAGAAFLWARSRDRRLLRLTLGGASVAAALFLRIQTPYIHHLDLIAPAIAAPVAASLMLVLARAPRAALMGLAGLAALTLSPLAAALNPLGLAPIAGLPRAPRSDLDELERLKNWVDRRARPDAKVCGLGSSYAFSGQLIGELWQLHPEREPEPNTSVKMPDVDEVDGPPPAGLKDCAVIIVGDPVQTHLDPDHQQTVVVPSREMLAGQGIGAKYRRTGEVFHLEKGVRAVVFERIAPLDDADNAALQARWRAARAALGFDEGP
jgi:hypothetical protein